MKRLLSVLLSSLPFLVHAQQAIYENYMPRPSTGYNSSFVPTNGYILDGLVEWNRLNDGNGVIAADSSGHGNYLTTVGAPAWESNYLTLNGSTQYAYGPTNQLVSLDMQDLTICAWINKSNPNSIKGIVDKGFDFGGTNHGGWGFWVFNDNRLDWWVQGGQDIRDSGPASIVPGQWTFVAVAWHYAARYADFYVNGALNSTVTNTGATEQPSSIAHLELGDIHDNEYSGSFAFDGSMRDFSVYNRALTSAELLTNYSATLIPTNAPTQVITNITIPDLLYYQMTESDQTTFPVFLTDTSTHGGTTGTVTSTDSNLLDWVPNVASIPASAINFDGVGTRLQTANPLLFNFTTSPFTINLWIRPLAPGGCLMGNGVYQTGGWNLNLGASYQIQLATETPGSENVISTAASAVQPGAWTMVTVARPGTTTALIYINGVQVATTGNMTIPASISSNLFIGVDPSGVHYYNGDMWLTQIWGTALTGATISNLYASQLPGKPWPPATAVIAAGPPGTGYLTNGLVEWNRLDDGTGTTASDSSGNGNTMPLVGSPAWGSNYLALNGTSQYGLAGSSQLSFLDVHDKTICAWINKTGSSQKGIVDRHLDIPGNFYGGWGLWMLANNRLEFWVEDGVDLTDYGGATVPIGQWAFVTVVWHHSADEADYYINGVLNSKVINGGANEGPGVTAVLQMGNISGNSGAGGYAFDGSMRDVGIYNRALSPAEVEYDFLNSETTTNVSVPDLLYYKMTEKAQTTPPATLADSSTHGGTTGTLFLDPVDSIQWVPNIASVPGAALHFNGVTEHIDTGNSVLFNFTTNLFTLNFWVLPLTANGYLLQNGIDLTNGWCVKVGGAYQLQFGTETNGTESLLSTQPSTLDSSHWTMVTIVRNSPTNALIYINGIQAATTGGIGIPAPSTNSLVIGTDRAGAHYFDGNMWMTQIWSTPLAPADVANLFFIQSLGQPWP
jgi:hypothetical protein